MVGGEPLCKYCDAPFTPTDSLRRYCSTECRLAKQRELELGVGVEGKSPRGGCRLKSKGRYVYGWFDDGELFYIGRGVGGRYAKSHKTGTHGSVSERQAECEMRREQCRSAGRKFTVHIFRDGLTQEGAALIESVLIDLFQPACNASKGMSRQERPPLELPPHVLSAKKRVA